MTAIKKKNKNHLTVFSIHFIISDNLIILSRAVEGQALRNPATRESLVLIPAT
jgi:hypothetical protein